MTDVLTIHDRAKARQREAALKQANRIRSRRAEIKARLSCGELDIREVILDPPDILRGAKVADILAVSPRIGPKIAKRLLLSCGINNPAVEFGWMSPARLEKLAAAIPDYKPTKGLKRYREALADMRSCSRCGDELREGRSTCRRCARERVEA